MEQRNTPASTYLRSEELATVFMTIHRPMKTMKYVNDMCTCIEELEANVSEIRMKDQMKLKYIEKEIDILRGNINIAQSRITELNTQRQNIIMR